MQWHDLWHASASSELFVYSALEQALAHMGRLGDGVDEDADAVGAEVLGHRRADGQDDDVGVGLVFEDHLLGLLHGQPHQLRPRPLFAGALHLFRRGAHGRSILDTY
uniref:Uncharacterized protein n=1 Tax=Arundo donax TaxID=35708 RepID=A0A0A9GBI2_ARUDO